jgi:addiction module RelB/DinJ family antitoxin
MSRVQTIVDSRLKDQAEQKFNELGLNLSEGVRFILTNFVNGNIAVNFTQNTEQIKLSSEAKKRYASIMEDVNNDKNMLDMKDLD